MSESAVSEYSVLTTPEEWGRPEVRSRWRALLDASDNVNAMYGSPEWFDVSASQGSDNLGLVVARSPTGDLQGVVPVRRGSYSLRFDVSVRSLFDLTLKTAHILGSIPLLAPTERSLIALQEAVLRWWPDCEAFYSDVIPADDPWGTTLIAHGGGWTGYVPDGSRPWYLSELPDSGRAFVSTLSAKLRKNIGRDIKRLEAEGTVRMWRADGPEHIDELLESARIISRNAWQQESFGGDFGSARQASTFASFARASLLRSYVLYAASRPCALVIGYQYNGIYHYAGPRYDRAFATRSPGTILLYYLAQDLCDHHPARLLNFGAGDADYKRRFSNIVRRDFSVLRFRRTVLRTAEVAGHKAFRRLVRAGRRLVKREATDAA